MLNSIKSEFAQNQKTKREKGLDLNQVILTGLLSFKHSRDSLFKAVYPLPVTFRRHEAADGRTHADDARTTTHDASSSTNDDASQAGHDATRQIRASGFSPFFVATNRHCLVRTLGFIDTTF